MKKLIALTTISFISVSVFSGTSCNYDYWGNYVCNGTGNDIGFRSSTTTDYWGNDNYSDNNGNSFSCSTDYWGNYICD